MHFEMVSEPQESQPTPIFPALGGALLREKRMEHNSIPKRVILSVAHGVPGGAESKDLQNHAASFASLAVVEEESVSSHQVRPAIVIGHSTSDVIRIALQEIHAVEVFLDPTLRGGEVAD